MQKDTIRAVYDGRDGFMWLPTEFNIEHLFLDLPVCRLFDYNFGLTSTQCMEVIFVLMAIYFIWS